MSARRWLVPLGVAAAWCALILLVHRDSPRTLVSAHGLLHAAIANELAPDAPAPTAFATPPENPLFAGRPLPYYYFFQSVAARLAALLHVDVVHAFELLILAAAALVVLLGFWIGRCIHGGASKATLAYGVAFPLLFFAGTSPQGPLVLLARWVKHGRELFTSRGFAADGAYLWGLVHPASGAMRLGDEFGTLGPLATYFFNVTARPLALASLVAVIALLAPAIAPSFPRRWLAHAGLVVASTVCTLFSPLIGIAAAGALTVALAYVAIRWSRPGRTERFFRDRPDPPKPEILQLLVASSRNSFRGSLLAAGALLLGVALAWPWWRHLVASGAAGATSAASHVAFHFDRTRALGVVASAWLLFVLAFGWPHWFWSEAGFFVKVLRLAGLLLAIPTAFVALPVGNEDNFLHAALVCWSCLAASAAVPDPPRPKTPTAPPKPDEGAG
jgi:hypothetical protein